MLYIFDINIVCPYEICEFILFLIWWASTIHNFYACLILLIRLWATKINIVFYQVWFWEKVDNLQKFPNRRNKTFVGILIFLVFSESDIQYLWQGEISFCKVQVPIKVVPVKNNYFLHSKFELHGYQQVNRFLYWCSFYLKTFGAYISHELVVQLIPTWIWYDLLTVS